MGSGTTGVACVRTSQKQVSASGGLIDFSYLRTGDCRVSETGFSIGRSDSTNRNASSRDTSLRNRFQHRAV